MSHIVYQAGTVITSPWLNDVDTVVYTYFGTGTALNSPTKLTISQVSSGAGQDLNLGLNGVAVWAIANGSGNLVPLLDASLNLGASNKRIATFFTSNIDSGSGALTLKGGGVTALTATGANLVGAGSLGWGTGVASFGMVTKRKTADQSQTTNTTLTNDTDLVFTIAANEEWVATFYIDTGAALNSTGFQIAVNAPAGATVNATGVLSAANGAATSQVVSGRSAAIGGAILNVSSASIPSSTSGLATVTYWILNGATPGTVNLQWAQGTSNGTPLTFRKGSFMKAIRIA